MKEEEQRLRDEISYLSHFQEFDKLSYSMITTNLLELTVVIVSVIIGLSAIILPLEVELETKLTLYFLLGIMILILLTFFEKRYGEFKNSRKNYSDNLRKRNEMIEKRYAQLNGLKEGKFKEKLDKELKKQTNSF